MEKYVYHMRATSYTARYRIGDLGTSACPAGRLMYDVPTFTGHGGGGRGGVAAGAADEAPIASTGAAAVGEKYE